MAVRHLNRRDVFAPSVAGLAVMPARVRFAGAAPLWIHASVIDAFAVAPMLNPSVT